MRLVRLIAIVLLAFELPVPLYWLVLHAPVAYWRRHVRAAFLVAVVASWGIIDPLLYWFRSELFRRQVSLFAAAVGLLLIAFDVFTFTTSEASLGGHRIVGHSELAGSRELIAHGLYARVRHPRYLGMITGVIGTCVILASASLWIASGLWLLLALSSIYAEERELRARLGPVYAAYAQEVPALLPLRLNSRSKSHAARRAG